MHGRFLNMNTIGESITVSRKEKKRRRMEHNERDRELDILLSSMYFLFDLSIYTRDSSRIIRVENTPSLDRVDEEISQIRCQILFNRWISMILSFCRENSPRIKLTKRRRETIRKSVSCSNHSAGLDRDLNNSNLNPVTS